MKSNARMAWSLLLSWAALGCAPSTPEGPHAAQSFSLQVQDFVGRTAWRPTRPSFDALRNRTAVRLDDDRVLIAGGFDDRTDAASPNAELFDPVTETWKRLPNMNHPHSKATGFLLSDGRALVIGGLEGELTIPEVFDPATETWTAGQRLEADLANEYFSTTMLGDGRVLIAGGVLTPQAYFFDPTTLAWAPAPPMTFSRSRHTAALLLDGRVLLAGGIGVPPGSDFDEDRLIAEVFDPQTNQWYPVAALNRAHSDHSAHVLPTGRVLLLNGAGGHVEIYDPENGPLGTWTVGPSFAPDPAYGERTGFAVTTLGNDRVLMTGGYVFESFEPESLYFEDTNSLFEWLPGPKLFTPRDGHSITLLQNGQALMAGGASIYYPLGDEPLSAAELYTPEVSAWQPLPTQEDRPGGHVAPRLRDGRVLLAGWSPNSRDSYLFLPESNTFQQTAPLSSSRNGGAAALLPDGRVLVVGGEPFDAPIASTTSELFDPQTERWTAGPSMNGLFFELVAARLTDGRVLVAGTPVISLDEMVTPAPELFDPQSGTWTPLAAWPMFQVEWTSVAALPDGRALLGGYESQTSDAILVTVDVKNGAYTTAKPSSLYSYTNITLIPLADGQVLVASPGSNCKLGLFDPVRQEWRYLGNATVAPPVAKLATGELLWTAFTGAAPSERGGIYIPGEERFLLIDLPEAAFREERDRATELLDGRVLVTGQGGPSSISTGAYVYGKANGVPCAGAFECASSFCVDGYCCNEACDDVGSCNACAYARGASANGKCTVLSTCDRYQCAQIVMRPDGQETSCTKECSRATDCAAGYVCNLERECVEAKNYDVDRGCSFTAGEDRPWLPLGLAWMLMISGRVRRAGTWRRKEERPGDRI